MKIGELSVSEISFSEYNPRKDLEPGDPEYESLKRSIQEFGYVTPIIVNERNKVVVGGHQRLKILRDLGYAKVKCVLVQMDQDEEKLLNIALNKLGGDWDNDKLTSILKEFEENDFDATLTGFSETEINDLIGGFEEEDITKQTSNEDEKETFVTCPKCKYFGTKEDFKP